MNGKSVKIKVAKDKKAPSICYLIGGVNPKLLSTDSSHLLHLNLFFCISLLEFIFHSHFCLLLHIFHI